MWIGRRKEIRKLTFWILSLHSLLRSDEGLTLETSAPESLYGGQFTLSIQLIKPNELESVPYSQLDSFYIFFDFIGGP